MTKIKAVPTQRDEYADRIIAQLEKALALAKERPQEGLVIHMLGRDGMFDTFYTSLNSHQLVGMIEWSKHNLMGAHDGE